MSQTRGTALLALLFVPAPGLAVQLSTRVHVGVVASTSLTRDSILRPLVVEPQTAPAVTATVDWTVSPRLAAGGEVTLARANLVAREGSTELLLPAVTTLAVTAGLTVPLVARATGRLGIGGIRYFPSEEEGIFARGGATSVVGTAAVAYRWPVSERIDLGAEVRYDLHTFSTAELESRGFDGSRLVHRVGVGVTLGHRWGE